MSIHVNLFWENSEIILIIRELYVLNDHIDDAPMFRHGTSRNGSIALSLEKAKDLNKALGHSIKEYERLDRELNAEFFGDGDGI